MKENDYPDPLKYGSGSLLEIIDEMCDATKMMADIVKKQAEIIEQEKISSAIFDELEEERRQAENILDRIEVKLRR